MKSLRKVLALFVLTLALTCTTIAGEMSTGVASTPPQQQSASITGEMSTGNTATADAGEIGTGATATVDPITGIALSLLQSLLALF
jgi:ABC-type oligopeptide transport system substrate-binding subunit